MFMRRSIANSVWRLLSYTQPGSSGSPSERSSSPVEKNATRRRRRTRHFADAERSDQTEVRRAQDAAGAQGRAAAGEIFAGETPVGARHARRWRQSGSYRHCASTSSCGTTVSQPAGMQAPVMTRTHCVAATAPSNGWPASALPATVSSTAADGFAERGALECVAVHGRVVVRGHVAWRDDVFGQHAVERVVQRHAFNGGDGRGPLPHDCLRGRYRQRMRIVLGDATGKFVKRGHEWRSVATGCGRGCGLRWPPCGRSRTIAATSVTSQ